MSEPDNAPVVQYGMLWYKPGAIKGKVTRYSNLEEAQKVFALAVRDTREDSPQGIIVFRVAVFSSWSEVYPPKTTQGELDVEAS